MASQIWLAALKMNMPDSSRVIYLMA